MSDHFYSTGRDGTVLIMDNHEAEVRKGESLYIEVADDQDVPVSTLGFLTGKTSVAAVSREDAEKLYTWLGKWLGKAAPEELVKTATESLRKQPESIHESYERHPVREDKVVPGDLMRSTRPGETREGGPLPGDHDSPCSCGASGAIDGHAYHCKLRQPWPREGV